MHRLDTITVTAIEDVLTIPSRKSAPRQMQVRPAHGLSFCKEGEIRYTHKGRTFVSDRHHAVLLPKGAAYQLERTVDGVFPLINFQCDDVFAPDTFTVIPLGEPERYLRQYERLWQLYPDPRNHPRVMALFYEMLAQLADEDGDRQEPIRRAMAYLHTHYAEPLLTNATLAACAGVSEVWFRKQFLTTYGISPKQYILDMRLRKAQQLLTESSLTVTQVAETCGFGSIYHFCRIFKEKTGYTPTAYAARQRQLPL